MVIETKLIFETEISLVTVCSSTLSN